MNPQRMAVLALAAGVVRLAVACSAETIVLATLPDDDDAGSTGPHTSTKCDSNLNCPGEFCQFDHLNPNYGHCSHRPSECSDDKFKPVCGLTGITYGNDCYRKLAGENYAFQGDCEDNARRCDLTTTPCPIGTTCALLSVGSDPGSATCAAFVGTCWGYMKCPPPDNDDDDHQLRWNDCSTDTGALRCLDTCNAIRTGRPMTGTFDCH